MNQGMSIFDFIGSFGNFMIVLIAAYTAWENFVNKRFSKFGFDAWIFFIAKPFIGQKKINAIYKDKKRSAVFGVMMLLIVVGGIPYLITDFFQKVLPYFK